MISLTAQVTLRYRRQWKLEGAARVEYRHLTEQEEEKARERNLLREGIWHFPEQELIVIEPRFWEQPTVYGEQGSAAMSLTVYPLGWSEVRDRDKLQRRRAKGANSFEYTPQAEGKTTEQEISYANTPEATAARIARARARIAQLSEEANEAQRQKADHALSDLQKLIQSGEIDPNVD